MSVVEHGGVRLDVDATHVSAICERAHPTTDGHGGFASLHSVHEPHDDTLAILIDVVGGKFAPWNPSRVSCGFYLASGENRTIEIKIRYLVRPAL